MQSFEYSAGHFLKVAAPTIVFSGFPVPTVLYIILSTVAPETHVVKQRQVLEDEACIVDV